MPSVFLLNKIDGTKFSFRTVTEAIKSLKLTNRRFYDLIKKNKDREFKIISQKEYDSDETPALGREVYKYFVLDKNTSEIEAFTNLNQLFARYNVNYYTWKTQIKTGKHPVYEIATQDDYDRQDEYPIQSDEEMEDSREIARFTVISKYPDVSGFYTEYNVGREHILTMRPAGDEKTMNNQRWTILFKTCLLYTSPSPRDGLLPRMPSSA